MTFWALLTEMPTTIHSQLKHSPALLFQNASLQESLYQVAKWMNGKKKTNWMYERGPQKGSAITEYHHRVEILEGGVGGA